MTRAAVPKGATLVRSLHFQLPGVTCPGELRLFDGYASDGFKTDYTRRPCRWVEVELPQPPKAPRRVAWRFSGERFERAERAWSEVVEDLKRHLATFTS